MAHDARGRGGVHTTKLLDRLHQKERQEKAYNEVHCCKAFDLPGVSPDDNAPDLIPAQGETTPSLRSAHLRQEEPRLRVVSRLANQRRVAARGIGRGGAQERREPGGSAGVESAIGPASQAGDLTEGSPCRRILPLLKHERLDAKQREFARQKGVGARVSLNGGADK